MGAHIAVLSNPYAGKGRAASAADATVRVLRERGCDVRTYVGASTAQAADLAREALALRPRALVVVGGDGTLSGLLPVLVHTDVPVALVPAGTGNDLARALDLPRHDPARAAELALDGKPRRIDVGEITSAGQTSLFLTVAALGFDAKVSDRTNRLSWPRGRARYYLALLIELARLAPTAFRVSEQGGEPKQMPGTIIAVGNTDSYGGGMPVCQGAQADDGLLDVVHVQPLGRLRLIRLFPLLLTGKHLTRPEVTHRRTTQVHVSAPDLIVYADGERVGIGECDIRLRPAALTVMTPPRG